MARTATKHTVFDGMEFDDYEFREFPIAMYKGKDGFRAAASRDEVEANKKLGWSLTPPRPAEDILPQTK